MTVLIRGKVHQDWLEQEIQDGEFVRDESVFRNWVTADGAPGPTGEGGFRAEPGRYHLYVSHACPWAHRTVIFRKLKGLEDVIGLSVVEPEMLEQGWSFAPTEQGTTDPLYGFDYVHQLYTRADPTITTQVTVPILWDRQRETVVNNESAEIIRMFNGAFDSITGNRDDYYPADLRRDIDAINETVYENVNNGVYRCGFATRQSAYEEAFRRLFRTLDELDQRLDQQRYLVGARLTEADWRLFTTLVRFDAVYVGHFKCNLRRIADYPNLSGFLRELYQMPGIAETVHIDYIKRHYYYSHPSINPTRIVPLGPALALDAPHDRDRL